VTTKLAEMYLDYRFPERSGDERCFREHLMGPWHVLIVNNNGGRELVDTLLDWGIKVTSCQTIAQARMVLSRQSVSQVFCNATLPDGSYRDLVKTARLLQPETRVVVLVPQNSAENIFQEAIQAGAFDSIPSPVRRPEVQWEVVQAMRKSSQKDAA
jgi:DNA-binding NtrC family response regulator